LSSARRPAWSTRCSTRSRASCAQPNSSGQGRTMSEARSGEDWLIQRYFRPLAKYPGALGLTDDAAAYVPPPGTDLVLTADMVVGGIHFFADDAADMVAKKALRVNMSDLAAKGAKP